MQDDPDSKFRAPLTITDLMAGHGGRSVVSLSSFTLQPGERCLLRGPSGSGKTTLLHTMAGLANPLSGSIKLGDVDIYHLTESQRDIFRGNNIGIIFQTLHLIKSLSVIDNILLAPYVTQLRQDRHKALSLLDKLNILELADRPATDISQGQAQRVAIARALLGVPAIVLADEPTSSLDDAACTQTIQLLSDLSKEAEAMLIVSSHDSRVRSAFDQVITLGASS